MNVVGREVMRYPPPPQQDKKFCIANDAGGSSCFPNTPISTADDLGVSKNDILLFNRCLGIDDLGFYYMDVSGSFIIC